MYFDTKKEIHKKLVTINNNTNKMTSRLYNSINSKKVNVALEQYIAENEKLLKEVKDLYYANRVKDEVILK